MGVNGEEEKAKKEHIKSVLLHVYDNVRKQSPWNLEKLIDLFK